MNYEVKKLNLTSVKCIETFGGVLCDGEAVSVVGGVARREENEGSDR